MGPIIGILTNSSVQSARVQLAQGQLNRPVVKLAPVFDDELSDQGTLGSMTSTCAVRQVYSGVSWSSQSLIRCVILSKYMTKEVLTGMVNKFSTYFLNPTVNATLWVLESAVGKTVASEMIKNLQRFTVTGLNEMVEGLLRLVGKSFTYWQFLQIIADIGVRTLIESDWFKRQFGITGDNSMLAYCGGKAAAFSTCLLVAACCSAGPWGIAGAAIVWVVQELITFGLRVLFGLISTCLTVDKSDYFDRWLGPSMSLKVFNWMFGTDFQTTRQNFQ
ncbi:uncharacterized protein LOC142358057 [Convolutriloba macropyga]|uniref:uncharacterized protein LOC142358057 n=1 Tax=Convolutriloba macropyga TaxID=536237 RepID=UPI003F5202BC